jgi:copper resistance protein C
MPLKPSAHFVRARKTTSARSNAGTAGWPSTAMIVAMRAGLAVVVATAAQVPPAAAHAYVDRTNPAVNSSVTASPPVIKLWFTGRIQHAFSGVTVTDHSNQRVDLDNLSFPTGKENELDIGLKSLPPGTYAVHWHVLAIDGHSTEGSFTFNVANPH